MQKKDKEGIWILSIPVTVQLEPVSSEDVQVPRSLSALIVMDIIYRILDRILDISCDIYIHISDTSVSYIKIIT